MGSSSPSTIERQNQTREQRAEANNSPGWAAWKKLLVVGGVLCGIALAVIALPLLPGVAVTGAIAGAALSLGTAGGGILCLGVGVVIAEKQAVAAAEEKRMKESRAMLSERNALRVEAENARGNAERAAQAVIAVQSEKAELQTLTDDLTDQLSQAITCINEKDEKIGYLKDKLTAKEKGEERKGSYQREEKRAIPNARRRNPNSAPAGMGSLGIFGCQAQSSTISSSLQQPVSSSNILKK